MNNIRIEIANIDEAQEILNIYAYYVKNTAITFEYDIPTLEEFRQRMKNILSKYPYIVAKKDNQIIGYAYAGVFKPRAAYDWAVETTIYIKNSYHKMGIGQKLYDTLERILKEQGFTNLNACISYPIIENQYLTKNSAEFHQHLGYQLVGEFHQCGYKFNQWFDMIWMEKMIGEHLENQPEIIQFPDIIPLLKEKHIIS